MFKSKQIKQLKQENELLKSKNELLEKEKAQLLIENADLRHELEDQKDLARQREKFCLEEHSENYNRKLKLDKIEEILTKNNYGSIENLTNKILEVVRQQNKTTSK